MKLIKAKEIFAEAQQYLEGKTFDGGPHPRDLDKAERLINELLNNNLGNDSVLFMLGTLHMHRGNFGLAITLLSQVTLISPKFGPAWNNLALCYRAALDWDRAVHCAKQAAKLISHPDSPCNLAGIYLNRGTPEQALAYADQALAMDPDHIKARWHKAMALLELQRWGEAWDLHEIRLVGGANQNIAERNYHGSGDMTPYWDGKTKGRVVIHGEQGMGDEIMFATCIPDAIATGADIVIEPSPRTEKLFARSFPTTKVYGSDDVDGRRWVGYLGKPDFKCAIGSLPKFYRRTAESFPGTPYLKPDPALKAWWGDKLRALGNKPKIGLAWQGGIESTRVETRSFHPLMFAPLFKHDAHFVSLQYDPTARGNVEDVKRELGVKITHWPKAVEAKDPDTGKQSDLDELAALIAGLDLVISVPQTAFHFAGALGIPCWVLTPSEPDWRLAGTGTTIPWYSSVTLIRQVPGSNDWAPVLVETADRLGRFINEREVKRA